MIDMSFKLRLVIQIFGDVVGLSMVQFNYFSLGHKFLPFAGQQIKNFQSFLTFKCSGSERELAQNSYPAPFRQIGGGVGQRRGGSDRRGSSRGGRGNGGARGRGSSAPRGAKKENVVAPSKEKLDEEMDAYMSNKAQFRNILLILLDSLLFVLLDGWLFVFLDSWSVVLLDSWSVSFQIVGQCPSSSWSVVLLDSWSFVLLELYRRILCLMLCILFCIQSPQIFYLIF